MNTLELRNKSIDIGRFIAAFFVVCMHTNLGLPYLGGIISDIGKIAVPFFLLVSGYYLYSDDRDVMLNRTSKGISKLFIIILQAVIVYGIFRVFKYYYYGIDLNIPKFQLLPFLLVNDFYFTEHLWYLFAFIYVLVIIWLLCKFKRLNYLFYSFPIVIIIHFISILWSRIIPISDGKFWYEVNWLVVALPFVIIGFILKKYYILIKPVSHRYLYLISCILFIFIFIEHYAFKQIVGKGPGILSTDLLAVIFFIICALDCFKVNFKFFDLIANWGRNNSLNIYIYHVLIRDLFTLNHSNVLLNNSMVIFIMSLSLSLFIEYVSKSIVSLK